MENLLENLEWLKAEYNSGRSLESIAKEVGVSKETLRNRFLKWGVPIRRKTDHFKGQPKSEEWKRNMSSKMTSYWEGSPDRVVSGLKISQAKRKTGLKMGYNWIYVPGKGSIAEHRHIIEEMIGRRLLPSEHVHHKDGNKLNNDPDNLELLTDEEHGRLHSHIRGRSDKGQFLPG